MVASVEREENGDHKILAARQVNGAIRGEHKRNNELLAARQVNGAI
jgi:hypothetical protein